MSVPLRLLIVTDAFPPVSGGSGWSTYELARGLHARGHHVDVIKVEASKRHGIFETSYAGLRVTEFCRTATSIPVVRNLQKNERLWAQLERYLRTRLTEGSYDVVHGQHAMSTVPAIRAGEHLGVASVATVRDYWPVCYWSDLIYDLSGRDLCPGCSAGMMTRCVRPRAGSATPAAWTLIPYMRANLSAKRRALARAGAVIAPSSVIARDLKARAPELAQTSIYTIPHPVDLTHIDDIHANVPPPMEGPYVVYAGKLAPNKGVQYLMGAYREAGIPWPLVIVGEGPSRAALEDEARASGVDARFLGWTSRDETLTWIRHAAFVAFPSYGPESLSRVLIEASALGTPSAAMNTGGTRDIIHAGITGLLSDTPAAFAEDLRRLYHDERLRRALGAQARIEARAKFSAPSVVERVEQVYRRLLLPRAA